MSTVQDRLTPQERQRLSEVHYVSSGVYQLGSLSCAICGHLFPLPTSATQPAQCARCGTVHRPSNTTTISSSTTTTSSTTSGSPFFQSNAVQGRSAVQLFTKAEVEQAMAYVKTHYGDVMRDEMHRNGPHNEEGYRHARHSTRRPMVGKTAVDNRVIEEAFCESCGRHRPCRTFARQTRSADEGQTIFYQCTVCGAEWQQNS